MLVEDIIPGQGPLGGIYTGLSVCSSEQAFFFAADMPRIDSALVRFMIHRLKATTSHPCLVTGERTPHPFITRGSCRRVKRLLEKDRLRFSICSSLRIRSM